MLNPIKNHLEKRPQQPTIERMGAPIGIKPANDQAFSAPDTIEFNLLHPDGRPFDHLQYIVDQAQAIKKSIDFERMMLGRDRESLAYHRERIGILESSIDDHLISMGELALTLCRMRAKYKELARNGGQNHV